MTCVRFAHGFIALTGFSLREGLPGSSVPYQPGCECPNCPGDFWPLGASRGKTIRPGRTVIMNVALAAQPKHTNRLAREKSPYLLQHAHNPVDWFAWNDEAFEKSRRGNKPIFLSIGYSTCHWCHVMERESFEDEDTAAFLNQHFVSIKVDREERPDVDRIYMKFVQATTGQGGWPLNVFLTPELKPFFGGTYFPPDNRPGRPGFPQLLRQIHELWKNRRDDLAGSAAEIHTRLEQMATPPQSPSGLVLNPDILRNAGLLLKQAYDPRHGGFGGAPKFPQPSQPQFLLRYGKRFQDGDAVRMVLHTCERMAAGGIHDQLGGGFARYSVDAQWLVPHFEKMLYDNAQLAQLYLDAWVVSGELESNALSEGTASSVPRHSGKRQSASLQHAARDYASVARDVLDYVLRDMTHPDGGFYSAEDADSEGHEGKFYCWTRAELEKLLTPAEFLVAVRYFGVTEQGNFVDHSHPTPLPNQNVLSVVEPFAPSPAPIRWEGVADRPGEGGPAKARPGEGGESGASGASPDEQALLAAARKKMFEARCRRIRPYRDDKILASWNGLMLGAFARAYAVLGDETYHHAAEKNLAFLQANLWLPANGKSTEALTPPLSHPMGEGGAAMAGPGEGNCGGALFHRWRDGGRDEVQLLEAYAFLLAGVIDLYECTLEPGHLDFAVALAESLLAKFYDSQNGGFWQTVADAPHLILRVKEDYDGAEPSGNSVAMLALLKLGAITGRKHFIEAAEKSLRVFAARLRDFPQAVPYMLQALDFSLQEPKRVVVAGDPSSAKARELLRAVHSVYQPNKVVLGNRGAVDEFARTLPEKDGPAAYLCAGTSCQAPTSDVVTVVNLLR